MNDTKTWILRCPTCDALVRPDMADEEDGEIYCRNGHRFKADDAFALTTCEGCSGSEHHRSIPGVRFPTAVNSDYSVEWIERCDECEEFESDDDAADALVRAGRIAGWRWGKPLGSSGETPYAVEEAVVDTPRPDEGETVDPRRDEENQAALDAARPPVNYVYDGKGTRAVDNR